MGHAKGSGLRAWYVKGEQTSNKEGSMKKAKKKAKKKKR